MTFVDRKVFLLIVLICVDLSVGAPADSSATEETKRLFNVLMSISQNPHQVMFGHQQDTMLGAEGGHSPYWLGGQTHDNGVQGWIFSEWQAQHNQTDDLSDVHRLTGEYPAVIGFDIGDLKSDQLQRNRYLIQSSAERGFINTICMHAPNPVSNGSTWVSKDHTGVNISHTIRRILPGGDRHHALTSRLDTVADFLQSLTDKNGNKIPVIFRPYHEMNGGWFWWGTNEKVHNTPDDFKNLYKFTVNYLKNNKHVHNILYAYSPDKFADAVDYLKFYPGDEYVDVMGLDYYYTKPFTPSTSDFVSKVKILTDLSVLHNKVAALTEVGLFNNGITSHPDFWNDHVLNVLKTGSGTMRIAFVHAWINFCPNHHCQLWVPYKGHVAASNFMKFYHDPYTIFGSEMSKNFPSIVG